MTDHTSSITTLQANVVASEQYGRRDTLIMSGLNLPAAAGNENCREVMRKLLRQHLRINICSSDISIVYRLGKQRQNTADKRKVIFKLCRRDLNIEIFSTC